MKQKTASVMVCLFVIGFVSVVIWWPPAHRYHLGMTIQEAETLMSKSYATKKAALSYKDGPTAQQMEEDGIYMIEVKNQGVILFFNDHEKLIRIKRWWESGN